MANVVDQLFSKAQTYLRSAAVLYELGDYDSCASRSYFAMFYAAQAAILEKAGELPAKTGIRSAFVQAFVESGTLPQRAATALNQIFDLQEQADYSPTFVVSQTEAERALQEAEAFVNSIARVAGHAS